jgi:hypothetical protein
MLILGIFLDKKSSQYFLRKTHLELPIFDFAAVFLNFRPGEGGGYSYLRVSPPPAPVILALPFFSLSAWLTLADSPHAGG